MIEQNLIDVMIVVSYLLIVLVVGVYKGRNIITIKDFSIADRNFSTPVLIAAISATWIGGENCLGMSEEVFSGGIFFIFIFAGCIINKLIIAKFIAPRMDKFSDMISVGDIMDNLYGKYAKVVTGISGTLLSIGYVGAQISATGFILNYFFNVPLHFGVLISALVVVVYSTFGGIRSVTVTEVIQFAVLVITIPIIFSVSTGKIGGVMEIINQLPESHKRIIPTKENMLTQISLLIIFCIPFLDPAVMQRLLMAKNNNQIINSMKIAAIIEIPLTFCIGFIGLAAFLLKPDLNPNLAMPFIIDYALPIGLKGLAIAGMLAVIMSSADSFLNTAAISFTHDFLKPLVNGRNFDNIELKITKLITLFFGLASIFAAIYFETIIQIVLKFLNFWGPIVVVPLFSGIMGFKTDQRSFIYSSITGALTFIIWDIFEITNVTGFDSLIVSMLLSSSVFYFAHIIFKKFKSPISIENIK